MDPNDGTHARHQHMVSGGILYHRRLPATGDRWAGSHPAQNPGGLRGERPSREGRLRRVDQIHPRPEM